MRLYHAALRPARSVSSLQCCVPDGCSCAKGDVQPGRVARHEIRPLRALGLPRLLGLQNIRNRSKACSEQVIQGEFRQVLAPKIDRDQAGELIPGDLYAARRDRIDVHALTARGSFDRLAGESKMRAGLPAGAGFAIQPESDPDLRDHLISIARQPAHRLAPRLHGLMAGTLLLARIVWQPLEDGLVLAPVPWSMSERAG